MTNTTTIRQLEDLLFEAFPPEGATPGDRIGLVVGSTEAEVSAIALALDAKVATIEAAAAKGCNVLVTHHPAFWLAPTEFLREGSSEGAAILRAAELGVALIGMHTNLDSAPRARELLLEPAGFAYAAPLSLPGEVDRELNAFTGNAEALVKAEAAGVPVAALGQLGRPLDGQAVSLQELACCYREAFGLVAKVWGDPEKLVSLLASCSGGGGSLVARVISTGADCYVTGEVAYHQALELAAAGVALIELGHDRSELPYRFILKSTLEGAGFDPAMLHILDPVAEWRH